jgi:hypothetical protein
MSKSVIFDVSNEAVSSVAEQIRNVDEDSMLVLAPISGDLRTFAPAKTGKAKGYHRIKMEVWIPEDAIIGDGAITDFGIVTMMRLPKSRVVPRLISSK